MEKKDLTKGNIAKLLIRLALPLIAGNILQQLYHTIDALVIGHYGGQMEFAAIGIAGSVMNLFLFLIVGACTGISVILAQQYGMGDMAAFRCEHFIALTSGVVLTVFGSILGIVLLPAMLRLIQTPDSVFAFVNVYLIIIFAGLPAAFFYNFYSSLLRAVGDTKAALMVLAASVGVNLILDILFVAKLGGGMKGAALATVLAQVLSAVLCVAYLQKTFPQLLFHAEDCRMDWKLLKKTVHFAAVTGLHNSGLYLGKLFVQGAVNTGGTELIAAYTATTRIEGFANSFGDSGAAATSVIAAQNFGAGQTERVRECFRKSLRLLFGLGVLCSLIMYSLAGYAAAFVLGQGAGLAYDSACAYLRTISVFYVLCFTGSTYAGYFDGIGKVSVPTIGAISHISLRVILSWIWIGTFGLNSVAWATGIGWIFVNGLWTVIYLRTRKLLHQKKRD